MVDRISECRVCGCDEIVGFFDLGEQPFANSLTKAKGEGEKYPLSLSRCERCSCVQLDQTASPEELFSDYVWVTGTSSVTVEYSRRFCEMVLERADGMGDGGYVLEAASNDGTFLKPFIDKGYDVLGVDPARNIVEKAVSEGVPTRCGFFGAEIAGEIVAERGRPGVVFARNVLPHVANLRDFLRGIEWCAGDETLVVIEVHYAKVILEELHYDSIYHEHLCYFTLKSIEELLGRHGLYVSDVMESAISGGSIVLFAGRKKGGESEAVWRCREAEERSGANELSSWRAFAERAYSHRDSLREVMDEEVSAGRKVVGYGASARSSTLLNFCGLDGRYIRAIADQNALKQGRFTAGTGIAIESPEAVMSRGADTVLLLAWNFAEEIRGILRERFWFEGRVIVPLPNEPRVLDTGSACVCR